MHDVGIGGCPHLELNRVGVFVPIFTYTRVGLVLIADSTKAEETKGIQTNKSSFSFPFTIKFLCSHVSLAE